MDSDIPESPEDRHLTKLRKAIDQSARMEQLQSSEDFQFFIGWVRALRDELAGKILRGDLLAADIRQEDHAKGGYKYLSDVIDYAGRLQEKAAIARKKLRKYETDMKELRGEPLDDEIQSI